MTENKYMAIGGKTVYQTGAINAKGINVTDLVYRNFHKKENPPPEFQFSLLFLQMRNALMHETDTKDSIVVHTTFIGEGVFGNKKYMSMIALQAAILSLPPENRGKIKNVYFGSCDERDALDKFGEFGKKTSKVDSVKLSTINCQWLIVRENN